MDPLSPLRPPEKPAPAESPLGQAERSGDSHGQSFRFWGRAAKDAAPAAAPPKNKPAPSDNDAVNLNLSPTARNALARRKRKDH
ncbi:MAG: hypothetical protein RL095_1597 [Verrucomicrobiota bacterium]|jgi:hypothetical protein